MTQFSKSQYSEARFPKTTVILAMSADGKISDGRRSPARFASPADKAHLEAQVARADAVLFGAGTLRAYGTTLSVRSPQLRQQRQRRNQAPQPVQMVCSPSGRIDPQARFFRQPVPRWLLTTAQGAQTWAIAEQSRESSQASPPDGPGGGFSGGFDKVWVLPSGVEVLAEGMVPPDSVRFDWCRVWRSLAAQGFEQLAVLGGGQLTAALFEAGLVQELWLTVCPLILGGAGAPTPVDGRGFLSAAAPRLRLRSTQRQADELFLQYDVISPR